MPSQPTPPRERLTTSNPRRTAVPPGLSPNAVPIALIRSASLNIIGDQRARPGTWRPWTPASTTSAVGASCLTIDATKSP